MKHLPVHFVELIPGKKYCYAIYMSHDGSFFLPIILDELHSTMFREVLAGKDYKSLDYILPLFLFVFDLFKALSCSLQGIFLKMSEATDTFPPTLEAEVHVSQSNEIGTCAASVSLTLHDAAAMALMLKQSLLFPDTLVDEAAIHIPFLPGEDESSSMDFIREQVSKFDSGT